MRSLIWLVCCSCLLAGCVTRTHETEGDSGGTDDGDSSPPFTGATDDGGDPGDGTDVEPTGTEPGCDEQEPVDCGDDCMLWEQTYQGSQDLDDYAVDIVVDSRGDIIVVGRENQSRDGDADTSWWMGKYDASGEPLWERSLESGMPGYESANAVAVDSSDNIIVVGDINQDSVEGEAAVVVLDPDGEELWRRVDVSGASYHAVVVDGEGGIIAAGLVHGDADLAARVRKYSRDGDSLWALQGADLDGAMDAVGLAGDTDGSVVAVGSASDGPNSDVWAGRLSSNGIVQWLRSYDFGGTGSRSGEAIAFLPGGDLIMVGVESDDEHGSKGWVAQLDAGGNEAWHRTYEGVGCCANGHDAVVVGRDGRVFVFGVLGFESGGGIRAHVMQIACEGEALWEMLGDSDYTSYPGGIALDASGDLLISGSQERRTGSNQSAAWFARYDTG